MLFLREIRKGKRESEEQRVAGECEVKTTNSWGDWTLTMFILLSNLALMFSISTTERQGIVQFEEKESKGSVDEMSRWTKLLKRLTH